MRAGSCLGEWDGGVCGLSSLGNGGKWVGKSKFNKLFQRRKKEEATIMTPGRTKVDSRALEEKSQSG